jgi:hypothetical protein
MDIIYWKVKDRSGSVCEISGTSEIGSLSNWTKRNRKETLKTTF